MRREIDSYLENYWRIHIKMFEFTVTVKFRMNWAHFDDTLTNYIMSKVREQGLAKHVDRLEIERVKEVIRPEYEQTEPVKTE